MVFAYICVLAIINIVVFHYLKKELEKSYHVEFEGSLKLGF